MKSEELSIIDNRYSYKDKKDIDNIDNRYTEEDIIALKNAIKLRQDMDMQPKRGNTRPELIGDIMRRKGVQTVEKRPTRQLSKSEQKMKIAQRIADKLNDQAGIKFYLKCAWRLSEDQIWTIVEIATTRKGIRHPERYATACLHQLF